MVKNMSNTLDKSRKKKTEVYPLTFNYYNKHKFIGVQKAETKAHYIHDLMGNENNDRDHSRAH